MNEVREQVLELLRGYIEDTVSHEELVKRWPKRYRDDVLDCIVNDFCEPFPALRTYRDGARLGVRAIEGDWSLDEYDKVLDESPHFREKEYDPETDTWVPDRRPEGKGCGCGPAVLLLGLVAVAVWVLLSL